MPTIDPKASAVEAIAASLEGDLVPDTLSAVLRGWPEDGTELDLSGLPVLSVTGGDPRIERCSPKVVHSVTVDGVTEYWYRVGWMTFTAQLDLWAAYRAQVDDASPAIEDACIQAPPLPPELRLTQGSYYDRPITLVLGDSADDLDGDSAKTGQWRKSWDAEVTTDLIRTSTHPRLTTLELDLLASDTGEGAAETVAIITPE